MNQLQEISYNSLTPILLSISVIFGVLVWFKSNFYDRTIRLKAPPSPFALPIIGHLYLLSKYPTNPWQGFNEIRKKYGNIVSLRLGEVKAVMVSSPDAMREVLLLKGDIFCDRPSFYRHSLIFGRDKDNSLALCDWSDLQRIRRTVAQSGVMPRFGSKVYKDLAKCIESEVELMMKDLISKEEGFLISKQYILIMCTNIFLNYLCSRKLPVDDEDFNKAVYKYDFVFYDINQCYALDFIPFLKIFGSCKRHLNKIEESASTLREYVEKEIVSPRLKETEKRLETNNNIEPKDFLDSLLEQFLKNPLEMNWMHTMFVIGDLIGGSSAVGNLLMQLIGHLAVNPSVQEDLHNEAVIALTKHNSDAKQTICLEHRPFMPLTESSILETLRIASSPIVPHVNNEDTTLQGYDIEKGTMILFNSFHLNMSDKLWSQPLEFNPSRFLTTKHNETYVSKPDHFFPFSSGRRSCLGYKMVNTIIFTVISNLVLKCKINPINDEQRIEIRQQLAPKGCLALSAEKCFKVSINPRTK